MGVLDLKYNEKLMYFSFVFENELLIQEIKNKNAIFWGYN